MTEHLSEIDENARLKPILELMTDHLKEKLATLPDPRNEAAQELQQRLDREYDPEWREQLAEAATDAALLAVGEAYNKHPHVRNAAKDAARIALGLKPLPTEQGEE